MAEIHENWDLEYSDYDPDKEKLRETLLTTGNGYLGTRGCLEESKASKHHYPGTYFNGLFNRLITPIAGRDIRNEDFVNCPDWTGFSFRAEGNDWFDPEIHTIEKCTRTLDLKKAVLHKDMTVQDDNGRKTRIRSSRFNSMANPHLASILYSITPLNWSGKCEIHAWIDGNVTNQGVDRYKDLNSNHFSGQCHIETQNHITRLSVETNQSKITIACAFRLHSSSVSEKGGLQARESCAENLTGQIISLQLDEGQEYSIEKTISFANSQDPENLPPLERAVSMLEEKNSYDMLLQKHIQEWENLWNLYDIRISGDADTQKILRIHTYHLLVTASIHNPGLDVSVPARGLHGEAYRGHIFWDELYILPFYILHLPETAKAILMYRCRRLDKAREYAKKHGYKGAMFPWQSGSDGTEETQVIHLNPLSGKWGEDYSSLQRHVSSAVAWNIWSYYHCTHDIEFLTSYGAEVILEISRFWVSLCKKTGDRYSISGVMGPNEYHEKAPDSDKGGLKDNAYTNIMAVWCLRTALKLKDILAQDKWTELASLTGLTDQELNLWKEITHKMNIAWKDGLIAQYDGFLELKDLDWKSYSKKYGDVHRMDRILKSEGDSPDNYKLSKQADMLMLFYVLPEKELQEIFRDLDYPFDRSIMEKNYDYYLQSTSHGSTLSLIVHAFIAAVLNRKKGQWEWFQKALGADISDIQGGTTREGIHSGLMAGTVQVTLNAYAGLDLSGEYPELKPSLPENWELLCFNFLFRGIQYTVELSHKTGKVFIPEFSEQPFPLGTPGEKLQLKPGQWTEFKIS